MWRWPRSAGGAPHTAWSDCVGEGRTRYLAIIGMSFSLLSFVATAMFLLAYIFEPLCAFE